MQRPAFVVAVIALILLVSYPTIALPEITAQGAPVGAPALGSGLLGKIRSDVGGSLGGAVIDARDANGKTAASVVSESTGDYTMPLGPGTYTVIVTAPAHSSDNATVIVSGAVESGKDFTLKHTGFVVRGTIRESSSGAPIANATIEAQQYPVCNTGVCPMMEGGKMAYRMPISTRSGADGRYAIAADEGSVNLRVWGDKYREAYSSVELQGSDVTRDIKLVKIPPKTAVLEGTVTDAKTGAPLAEAWVNAWPSYPSPTMEGTSSSTDAASGSGSSAGAPPPTTMPAQCSPEADCAMAPCCQEGNSTQTDASGRYRMAMYPGVYRLNVGAPDHGTFTQEVALHEGQTLNMDARLDPIPPDSVTIRGLVTDQATGKPLPGAYVSVENSQWGHYTGAQTGPDGRFAVHTKPGWTIVWVRLDAGGYGYGGGVVVPTEPATTAPAENSGNTSDMSIRAPDSPPSKPSAAQGSYYPWAKGAVYAEGQTVDLAVKLVPKPKADARIVGYVLNATSHKPIAGAQVNVRNEDTGDWGNTQTDKDGSYVLVGRAGTHTVQAYAEGYFQNAVVVAVDGAQTRVDLTLEPGHNMGCCIAYGRAAAMEGSAPPSSPAAAGGNGDGAKQQSFTPVTGNGPASYSATTQGLGPYDPNKAPTPNSGATAGSGGATGGSKTPGFEAALGVAALAAVGFVMSRKRR